MKFLVPAVLLLLSFASGKAQYYYKDIVSTRNTANQFQKYKEQKIRSVILKSFESDGSITEGFSGSQSINSSFTSLVTVVGSSSNAVSELTSSFNPAGQLVKTEDTTDGARSISEYSYNDQGQLLSINNVSTSPGQHAETETHQWNYTGEGKPESMLRIKNGSDSTTITFVYDEKGNIVEENGKRNGIGLPTTYYYYDNKNRLTDIVNYNRRVKRLLPAYVFDYNESGMISSMLVVPEGSSDYLRWQYTYNDDGLKTKETCMNKQKQIVGRIEYLYK